MATKPSKRAAEYDVIEPIGKRVVIRKDDNKRETRSGILAIGSTRRAIVAWRRTIGGWRRTIAGGQHTIASRPALTA